jgi:hypothetical protein
MQTLNTKNKMEIWQHLTRDFKAEQKYADRSKLIRTYDEIWTNDIYCVFVRLNVEQPLKNETFTWLSIKRHDKEPCNDWRHFQFIKNQLVGQEAEAVQLYPAESRLVDGSNQYHLWCIKGIFPFGFFDGRTISEHPFENGRQRSWPKNMRPTDMDEQNAKIASVANKYKKALEILNKQKEI